MAIDRGYQAVIEVEDLGQKFNHANTYLYLDTVFEKSVQASATIPTQPLQNGLTISDHMYRNPDTYSLTGKFSLYGAYAGDTRYDDLISLTNLGSGDRLKNIQEVFEYIKDNGILCNIITMRTGANGSTLFKRRNSMALKSIRWREDQVSMEYNFEFQEVIIAVTNNYPEKKADSELPALYAPQARSLGELLAQEPADENGVSIYEKIVMAALIDAGYIEDDSQRVLTGLKNASNTFMRGIAITGAIAGVIVAYASLSAIVHAGIATALASFGIGAAATAAVPGGALIVAGAVVVVGVILTIVKIVSDIKASRKRTGVFKLVYDAKGLINSNGTVNVSLAEQRMKANTFWNYSDYNRLEKLLDDVHNALLNVIGSCQFYQVSSSIDDNSDREFALLLGTRPYYVGFTTMNQYPWFKISVCTTGSAGDVSLDGTNGTVNSGFRICTSFDEMVGSATYLFRDASNQYSVYLYNPSLSSTAQSAIKYKTSGDPKKYLAGYYLVVVKGCGLHADMEKIQRAILNTLEEGGYIV